MATTEMQLFEHTRFQDPELPSQWRAAYRVECGHCHEYAIVPVNKTSGAMPPEMLRRKFQQLGWDIGQRRRGHVCPTCKTVRRAPLSAEPAPRKIIGPSLARRAAERAFEALVEPAAPPPPTASQHAAIVAECRALVALAEEMYSKIDDDIEAAIVRAEEQKLAIRAEVERIAKRLLV